MANIWIGNHEIGQEYPPYFIADIAANHDGDINRAFSLIEMAKEAGAHAAKFQNFKAKTIVSRQGFDSLGGQLSHQRSWSKSVYDVYEDASIPEEWTERLKEKCDSVGIEYMTSPYDFENVDLADMYSNCFKIGSGDITWIDMLHYVAGKGKPILLATGASTIEDVKRAVDAIHEHNRQLIVMQCNTNYTASVENFRYINLRVLNTYSELFPDVVLGLSDHTHGHETVLGALMLGARVIEKHFTDNNDRIGPDHKFSMTPSSWRAMVDASTRLFEALGDGVKRIEDNEIETAVVQRRGLYYLHDIPKGKVLSEEDLFPVRPIKEESFPPYRLHEIIGKKLIRDVRKDTAAVWEDFQ